jgi:hypothetical protein
LPDVGFSDAKYNPVRIRARPFSIPDGAAPILVSCLFRWKRRQRINAMNEKTIDQIEEEVLICKISDETVEAAGRCPTPRRAKFR